MRCLLSGLSVIVVGVFLLSGCGDVFPPSPKTVCITGYNQYERQFHKFRLDEENRSGCGGNPSGRDGRGIYGGGGGFVCGCRVIPGKEVSLYWVFAQNKAEYVAKIPEVRHDVRVVIPQPESSSSRYLRIFFMKSGVPQLQWVDDLRTPEIMPPLEEDIK